MSATRLSQRRQRTLTRTTFHSSDHSFIRKLWLHVELFYQTFNMLFVTLALPFPLDY